MPTARVDSFEIGGLISSVVPGVLRWLLSIVAAIALLGTSATSFAAAGFIGDSECCCPNPDTCKCHDHDKEPAPNPTMKRCGGEAKQVAPASVVATLVDPVEPVTTTVNVMEVEFATEPPPPDRSTRPEKPPL